VAEQEPHPWQYALDILFDGDAERREEIGDILMSMTCYPFGGKEAVSVQLRAIRAQLDSGLSLDDIRGIQEKETDAAMEGWREDDNG
jgi:hypothetical protein